MILSPYTYKDQRHEYLIVFGGEKNVFLMSNSQMEYPEYLIGISPLLLLCHGVM